MSDRQTLARAIKATAVYYNRQIEPEVLTMMCDDLSDLDPVTCIDAYGRYRRNPANRSFPLPAQIRELVNPEEFVAVETQAREIAARICGAIPRFGWCNSRAAEAFIGPDGWEVIRRQGGWTYLCEQMGVNINPGVFQAQVRDQLEGVLRYGLPAVEHAIGITGRARSEELASFAEILKLGDAEPDGAA